MLINEVRETIAKYDIDDLKKIIAELYKKLPKDKKAQVDEYLKDIHNKPSKPKLSRLSFAEECQAYDNFIALVKAGLYASPNRIVAKKERYKWRSLVNHYFKVFVEEKEDSLGRLIDLFKVLSEGSTTLLFSNWNTFLAIHTEQSAYYDIIIKRVLKEGYDKKNLEILVDLLNVERDEYTNLSIVLKNNMKTIDTKELLVDVLTSTYERDLSLIKKSRDYKNFHYKEVYNEKVDIATIIYLELCEEKRAKKYFMTHYYEESVYFKKRSYLGFLRRYKIKEEFKKEFESLRDKLDKESRDYIFFDYYKELTQENDLTTD